MSQNWVDNTHAILIVGATSGIGLALAKAYFEAGKSVVLAGRRQEQLDSISDDFRKKHSDSSATVETIQWDITDTKSLKDKVDHALKLGGGKINGIIISSGIQRSTDFTKPKELDFEAIGLEINTNFTAYIHLIAAFLPYLETLPADRHPWLGVISSQLGIVPMPRTPVYCGTKAAVHQMTLGIREQLRAAKSAVSLVEIYPPAVKTELHDKKNQPDVDQSKYPAISIDEFMEDCWAQLKNGNLDVPVGNAKPDWDAVDAPRLKVIRERFGS